MNVNKIFEHLSTPLPPELGGSTCPQEENRVEKITEFLKKHVPPSDQKEIDAEFAKNLNLKPFPKKKLKKPQAKKKGQYLTAREKRELKLFKLEKNSLKYKNFKKIHFLWQDYMQEILGQVDQNQKNQKTQAEPGRISAILNENLQLTICRADLHGSMMKITRALNPCLVGIQGIVVMETKNSFQMIDKQSVLRIIPKLGTSFTLAVHGLVITLSGSSLIMKPSDRAVKKWKRRPTFDL